MGIIVTPDGQRYLAASRQRVARPFHYRWLLPKLCGENGKRWHTASRVSSWALLPLMALYVGGWRGVAAAALVCGLAGVWQFNRKYPVLVDVHGMACALASADAFRHHILPLGLAFALLGGCVRETSPIFAALYAWNPLALLGVLPVAVRHLQREGQDVLDAENRWILDHPVQAARKYHAGMPWTTFALPWGVGLLALAHLSPQLIVTVLAGYALCCVATDTVRLYQWSFPVVLAAAVHAVPLAWLPPVVLLHFLLSPFRSEGG